jgi:hypothetical protein
MADIVGGAVVRSHANTRRASLDDVRAGAANVRMAAKDLENAPEYRELVREAMRRSGLSQKAFAIDAGQTESVISEALHAKRAFDVQWIWRQTSAAFRRALREAEDESMGLDPRSQREEGFDDFVELARRFWFRHERREERTA